MKEGGKEGEKEERERTPRKSKRRHGYPKEGQGSSVLEKMTRFLQKDGGVMEITLYRESWILLMTFKFINCKMETGLNEV